MLFPSVHLSRGPSPISLSTQEAWPVAAAITEYINAYFKGGQHNRWVWCRCFAGRAKSQCLLSFCSVVSLAVTSLFLSPSAVWWRSQATWPCPSQQASPGFSQPTPTFLSSASGWSTSRGSITSCPIKSCSTGRLSPSALCCIINLFVPVLEKKNLYHPVVCLHSDPSQSDPDTRDFWFNMQALQIYLQREAELNPQASYYNVGLLKYQVRV